LSSPYIFYFSEALSTRHHKNGKIEYILWQLVINKIILQPFSFQITNNTLEKEMSYSMTKINITSNSIIGGYHFE